MDESNLQMFYFNYLVCVCCLAANMMQDIMMGSWTVLRKIIINNDICMENFIVHIERYLSEKYLFEKRRSIWMKNRFVGWWENIVSEFSNEEFRENFRISRKTFGFICSELEHVLSPKMNPFIPRKPISVKKWVAITIFYYVKD